VRRQLSHGASALQLALLLSRLHVTTEANYEEESVCRDLNPRLPECAIALRIKQIIVHS
jgi:hypothetical protein